MVQTQDNQTSQTCQMIGVVHQQFLLGMKINQKHKHKKTLFHFSSEEQTNISSVTGADAAKNSAIGTAAKRQQPTKKKREKHPKHQTTNKETEKI